MPNLEIIGGQLERVGFAHTSFEELGINRSADLVDEIASRVNESKGSPEAMKVVEHIDKNNMMIVQDPICLELGRRYIKPAIEVLFHDQPEALETWALFGLNRYRAGGKFGPHRDYVGKSVLVFTVTGERDFDIYHTEPDDPENKTDFDTVIASYRQKPGSIMVLDRDIDPAHAVKLALTDGIVAVADVDGVIRG
ncbi:MAG TPA: hypothetical protein PKD15_03910 [Candidatus Saccharibacteria bacterium]|nr:hypothetical protein [Candidatus Saccharibacteria bacterium]